MRHSNSKNLPYYFNPADKNSRWEPPQGTDVEKLKFYMAKYHSGTVPTGEVGEPGKIRAAHLLVKHAESRRPSSWREVRKLPIVEPCESKGLAPWISVWFSKLGAQIGPLLTNVRLRLRPISLEARTMPGRSFSGTRRPSRAGASRLGILQLPNPTAAAHGSAATSGISEGGICRRSLRRLPLPCSPMRLVA